MTVVNYMTVVNFTISLYTNPQHLKEHFVQIDYRPVIVMFSNNEVLDCVVVFKKRKGYATVYFISMVKSNLSIVQFAVFVCFFHLKEITFFGCII